jgi:hypothetical protein
MGNYNDYIGQLKTASPDFNSDLLYSKINSRIKSKARNSKLLASGALMLFLFSTGLYINSYWATMNNRQNYAEEIAQIDESGNNSVINYIVAD